MSIISINKIVQHLFVAIFIVIMSTTTVFANKVFSQSVEKIFVKIALENRKATDFFKEIELQTKFTFVYAAEVAALEERFSINNNNISVKEVLDILAKRGKLSYMVSNTTVSIKLNTVTSSNNSSKTGAIQQVIKGKVLFNGQQLPGVNVLVKGSSKGAVTNFDGEFEIEASPADILVFSYVGFTNRELLVGDQKYIEIVLEEDINTLEQIVVVGYGTSTKTALTTAVSAIDAEDIIDDKPFTNVEQSLNGKVAGVQIVQQSGRPGSEISVRIRGLSSLNADNKPLFVVDGVQVNNTEGLNPSDIESVSILKDAASSAIYGARASNGVVLITTKRGTVGESTINFSAYYGENSIIKTLPVLNSEQYLDFLNDARINAGENPFTDPFNGEFNTDWQRELYNPGSLQNYQLSFTGGSEKGNYYLSTGYQRESGTIETTGFERFAVRFNQDQNIKKNLKVGNSISLTRTNFDLINDNNRVNQGGVVLGALETPPIIPVQNADGTYPQNPFQALDNPIALIRGEERGFKTVKGIVNAYGEYAFPFGLKIKTSMGVDYNNSKFNRFLDPFTTGNGRANKGEAQSETFLETVWLWENTLNYKFSILQDLNMDLLLGTSAQKSRYEETKTTGRDFVTGAIPTVNGAALIINSEDNVEEWANNSLFYRFNIDYKNKYFLSSSARRDGSSRFGPDRLYGLFPSISVSWVVSNEGFMENVDWLQTLKFRYSYGLTGNQFIGNNAWRGLLDQANYSFDDDLTLGFGTTQLQNRQLQWEATTEHNFGFDLGFLKNRFTLTTDIYTKKSESALLKLQLPATTGFDDATLNAAEIANKGFEIGLDAAIISNDNFSWNMVANYSTNKSEVIDLGGNVLSGGRVNDDLGNITRTEEGQPLGNFFGLVSLGVDPATGDIKFLDQPTVDLNGDGILEADGVINADDRVVIGNGLPDFTWGLTNTLKYKGLELTAFFQGVEGQDVYNATRVELETQARTKNQSITVLDRWSPTNTEGAIPRAVFGDLKNSQSSTRWVEDGSFVKLREVTLSYSFPKKFIEKIKLSKLKVYAQGRNLITWTDYSGYDPEVSSSVNDPGAISIDYGTYPQVKTFIGGINLSF